MARLLHQSDGSVFCEVWNVQIDGPVTNMGAAFACAAPPENAMLPPDGYFILETDAGERFTCAIKTSNVRQAGGSTAGWFSGTVVPFSD